MVNQKKVEEAVKMLLEGIGEDASREGLLETPERVARMYTELMAGMEEDAATHLSKVFTVERDDLVLVRDIDFQSICEHHLMPFVGKAHVAYIPNGKVTGLSKIARTVEVFARRLQIQEHMTAQIADAIETSLSPKGVMVVLEAEHMCMTMRGIKKPGAKTMTYAVRGAFETDADRRAEVLEMLR